MAKYKITTDQGSFMVTTEDAGIPGTEQTGLPGVASPPVPAGLRGKPTPTPGFLWTAGQEVIGGLKGAGSTALNLSEIGRHASGQSLIEAGMSQISPDFRTQREAATKKLRDLTVPQNSPQAFGYTAEQLAEFFAPVGIPFRAAATAGKGVKLAAEAAKAGTQLGAVEFAHTLDPAAAAKTAAITAGTVGAFGAIRGPLGTWLARNARSTYAKILQPTGGKIKTDVAKTLLPGGESDLLGRKFIGASAESMESKAADKATQLGVEIENRYKELGEAAQLKLKPIFDDVYAFMAKKGLNPDGTVAGKEGEKYVYTAMSRLNEIVKYLGKEFETADPNKLRKFRQLLDNSLYKPNAFGKTVKTVTGVSDEVTEELAHSIRRVLNSDPTLGALNREFHFWETAREVLHARNLSEVGEETGRRWWFPLGRATVGAVAGEEYGRRTHGTWEGAALGGIAGAALGTAMSSTAWKGASSVAKDQIAKLLASGAEYEAAGVALRETAGKTFDIAEKQKLTALGKQLVMEKAVEAAMKKSPYLPTQTAVGGVIAPPSPAPIGTPTISSPKPLQPAIEQTKAAVQQVAETTGLTPVTPGFQKTAKKLYQTAAKQTEALTSQANTKIEQKQSSLYSGPFGIVKHAEITPEEASAITHYKGSGYIPINKSLYQGGPQPSSIAQLDQAIAKHTLVQDMILWRGIKGNQAAHLKTLNVGDTFGNKGFSSTSSTHTVSRGFASSGGVLIKIEAKAGQKGYPYGFHDTEKEYLLPRGLKYRVKSIQEPLGSKIRELTVEIIP
jgi:hypothetical protein